MITIVIDAKLVTSAMVVMIAATAKIAKNAPCAMSVNTLLAPRC